MNLEPLLTRLKALRESFSTAQLLSMASAFIVVVGVIVGAAWWLNEPTYRVLFSELDPESAGRVSERLRAADVPFQLANGGTSILVPQERIDELRLDFAVNGLPQSGKMGWEIFDQTQFGATDFLEQVNFRRALEGELGRTIGTISEVAAARVHITPGKSSIFGASEQPAKASVMLKLRTNRVPAASTIQGIVALVAGSVESLQPEHVVVVDHSGRPLSAPQTGGDEALGGAQVERQRTYEMQVAKQIVDLLEPVVGAGAVKATVSARLYQNAEERLDENFGQPVIRSQELKEQGGAGSALTAGVAGARANVPGVVPPGSTEPNPTTLAASTQAGGITNPVSRSEMTNYEISKSTVKSTRPRGGVERLTVAVVIDDEHYVEKGQDGTAVPKTRPRTKEIMQRLAELATNAAGVDPQRGDAVTVHNIAFSFAPVEEPEKPGIFTRFGPQIALGLKLLVILLLGSAAFFFVGRQLLPSRKVVDALPVDGPVLPRQLPKTIEEIEDEIAAQLDSAAVQLDRRLPVLTKKLTGLAQKDPETAARLIRTWLLEDQKK